jgi:hypothetical protein
VIFIFDSNSQSSYYKVKCELSRDYLILKNGRKGQIKKGMTVYAHFILTRVSVRLTLFKKLISGSIPHSMPLDSMLMKQGTQVKQHDITDCGPACLASICAYHGLRLSHSENPAVLLLLIRKDQPPGLIEVSKRLGLVARGVRGD